MVTNRASISALLTEDQEIHHLSQLENQPFAQNYRFGVNVNLLHSSIDVQKHVQYFFEAKRIRLVPTITYKSSPQAILLILVQVLKPCLVVGKMAVWVNHLFISPVSNFNFFISSKATKLIPKVRLSYSECS